MPLPIEHSLAKLPQQVRAAATNGVFTKIGVVKNVIAQDGQPSMAIVDFDDETGVETKLQNGQGTPTHPGMTVRVERKGGVIDPTWQIVDVLSGPRISFGEPIAALMAKPVIPGASFGGVYTESNTATADNPNAIADPGAPVKAKVYLYVRSIVPGSYSAYQQRAKAVRVQARELGDTEWPEQANDWPLSPNSLLYGYMSGAIGAASTSLTLVVATDRINDMLVDQPAYWQIESEILLAIATNNGGGSFTLSVVAHNGIDDATLGQGFVASASGRGLEGTTAASHAHNSVLTLLSANVAPGNLKPATDYELRVAFVNASGQAGPWSDIVGVTTWEQPIPPAAPVFVASPNDVQHLSAVIQAQWSPVITDANGDFRSDVRRYIAVRHTAALAVGLSLASVLSAGATQVADTPATVISVPATKGVGNFIGVAAVGSEGLLSEWDWASDTLAPPYPDPADVTFISIPRAVLVNIPPTADSRDAQTGATIATPSQEDPGFYEFVLWKAATSTGAGATIVARFTSLSHVAYLSGGLTGWYKVAAADRTGNANSATAPNNAGWTSGWKFCASLFAEDSIPENGNFQDPNETETDARGWTRSIVGSVSVAQYQNTGGIEGNRSYFSTITAPGLGNYMKLSTTSGKVFPAHATNVLLTLWAKPSVFDTNFVITGAIDLYSDDDATVYLGTINLVSGATPLLANTWGKISNSAGSPISASYSTARSAKIHVFIQNTNGALATPYNISIDAVKLVFT